MESEGDLGERFPEWFKIRETGLNAISVEAPLEKYVEAARFLRSKGYDRLLMISGVDWAKKNHFEVYFVLYHLKKNLYLKVSVTVPREKTRYTVAF